MKIGLVTFHCSYNFGSVLQAYALKTVLEQSGHSVSIIDYRSRDFRLYQLFRLSRPEVMIDNVMHLFRNINRKRSFESFIQNELNPTPTRYTYRNERKLDELADKFDCFICGSDQIWNLDCTHGPVGPFFLSFAGDKRRVAYAPSLAHVRFREENFGPDQRKMIKQWLSRFSAVSVREGVTAGLFQPLSPVPIQTCLDPTMLLEADAYSPITASVPGAAGTLFVYMLEENADLIVYAGTLAREMGLTVSYVFMKQIDFGVHSRNYYGVGPSEFLGLVRGCSAVVTNSFHATVFSMLFGTPFLTFATERSGSRMRELLEMLDESGHLTDGTTVVLPYAVSPDDLADRLEKLRADSFEFLRRALEE